MARAWGDAASAVAATRPPGAHSSEKIEASASCAAAATAGSAALSAWRRTGPPAALSAKSALSAWRQEGAAASASRRPDKKGGPTMLYTASSSSAADCSRKLRAFQEVVWIEAQ